MYAYVYRVIKTSAFYVSVNLNTCISNTKYQDIQPDINQIQPISSLCIYEYERLSTYRALMSHNTKLYCWTRAPGTYRGVHIHMYIVQ